MNSFNLESKENRESYVESQKMSEKIEQKIQEYLLDKKEVFADIVTCPAKSCGSPIRVELKDDQAFLHCSNCGWQMIVKLPTR